MLLLIRDIRRNPRQIPLPEAHDPESALPLENLPSMSFVDLEGTGSFQFPHEIADCDVRLDIDRHVDVGRSAIDAMQINAFRFRASFSKERKDFPFQFRRQERQTGFGVPGEMKIDLVEDVRGNDRLQTGDGRPESIRRKPAAMTHYGDSLPPDEADHQLKPALGFHFGLGPPAEAGG